MIELPLPDLKLDPPADGARIIRSYYVPLREGYVMSGEMFKDGLSRLVVHPNQIVKDDLWMQEPPSESPQGAV